MNDAFLTREAIDEWIVSVRGEYERALREWVEIPSVSLDYDRRGDIKRQADVAMRAITAIGGETEVISTTGNPVLHGSLEFGPGCPTITIYNHLDVQPATEPEWKAPPFVFRKDGETYFGRGATDDKGPALTALFAARYARKIDIPVNIRFLWELEEEIGSPHFAEALGKGGERLATDVVVVSDTVWISRGKPAIAAGLRGSQMLVIKLETGATDQHSGVTGGVARNPVAELAQLVSEMHDARTGRVKIPGFYDAVEPPTRDELDGFRSSGFTASGFMKDHHFKSVRTKNPMDMMKRLWAEPTFELHGIVGGYAGPGVKTIIPPRAEAKISMRLVPNQNADAILKLVKAFVKQRCPDAVVEASGTLQPFRGQTTGPFIEAAKSAFRFGFGRLPALVREGGSIGAVITMQRSLDAPIVFLGLSLPEHGYHAPNEFYDWGQAAGGIRTFVRFFAELARMGRAGVEAARQSPDAPRQATGATKRTAKQGATGSPSRKAPPKKKPASKPAPKKAKPNPPTKTLAKAAKKKSTPPAKRKAAVKAKPAPKAKKKAAPAAKRPAASKKKPAAKKAKPSPKAKIGATKKRR